MHRFGDGRPRAGAYHSAMNARIAALLLVLALHGCSSRPVLAPETRVPVVEVVDARTGAGYARIEWRVRNGEGLPFTAQRRHAEQPWKTRATLTPDAAGRMVLEDRAVLPGEPYSYGVLIPGRTADEVHATVTVDVPEGFDPRGSRGRAVTSRPGSRASR